MPNEHETLGSLFTDIADAIRAKTGGSADIVADNFPSEIASIPSGGLPSGYEAVEYIESSGTQYIDTGFKPDKWSSVRMTYKITTLPSSGYHSLFAVSNSNYTTNYFGGGYDRQTVAFKQSNTGAGWYYTVNTTDKVTFVFGGGNVGRMNETSCYFMTAGSTNINSFSNSLNLSWYLMALNLEGTATEMASLKLYHCEIFNNRTGEVGRNFVPCYRKSDKEIGLYDLANGAFYTNAGTGSFTCYPAPPA